MPREFAGWVIYEMPPVDFPTFLSLPEFLERSADLYDKDWIMARFVSAIHAICECTNWEGDVRQGHGGPYVIPLPPDSPGDHDVIAFMLKQDNNGVTYLASPHALPYLNEEDTL